MEGKSNEKWLKHLSWISYKCNMNRLAGPGVIVYETVVREGAELIEERKCVPLEKLAMSTRPDAVRHKHLVQ